MAEKLLEIKDLSVRFPSDGEIVHAVNGVNLTVHKGTTLGLVGETGAGKTTIAKSILHILPKTAKIEGEVLFEDQDMTKLSDRKLQKIRGKSTSVFRWYETASSYRHRTGMSSKTASGR